MAQWMTHLRVAEAIAKAIPQLDNEWFYFGNIAADSGRVIANHTFLKLPSYDPPTQVTHWSYTPHKRSGSVQPDKFYDEYIKPQDAPFNFADRKTAFYWGYFAHLLTDILWVDNIITPVKEKVKADQQAQPDQADRLAKIPRIDWSDIDALFLEQHPKYRPLEIIRNMAPIQNDLLPYFDETAMEEKRKECLNYYDTYQRDPAHTFVYTQPEDATKVVTESAALFLERLKDKQFQADHRAIRDITDFIFINDTPKKSDLIIVLGGSSHKPSETAALLYHAGLAPQILATGRYSLALGRFAHEKVKVDKYKGNFETESDFIENILRMQDVPAEAIIKESNSMHTMENAEFSAALLKELNLPVKRAILCCKAYHARRALMHFSCHFPGVQFYVVPSGNDGLTAHNWYQTEKGYHQILSEVKKCGTYFADYHRQLLQ